MESHYKLALELTKQKKFTSIAMLILNFKDKLKIDLSYSDASELVEKMSIDGVVSKGVIDVDRINELLKS